MQNKKEIVVQKPDIVNGKTFSVNPDENVMTKAGRSTMLFGYGIQIVMGLSVSGISLIGLIQPSWLAALLNFAGCVNTMLGAWLLYDYMSQRNQTDNLIRNSIRNVLEFRN